MIAPLIRMINEESREKFDNFRLKSMKYLMSQNVCQVFWHYRHKAGQEDYRTIEDAAKLILPEGIRYRFYYARVEAEDDAVRLFVRNVLFETYKADIPADAVTFSEGIVTVRLPSETYCRLEGVGARAFLADQLDTEYCRAVTVRFAEIPDGKDASAIAGELMREMRANLRSDTDEIEQKRVIQPFNIEKYIGEIVTGDARYISDAKPDPEMLVSFCGKLTDLRLTVKESSRKPGKQFTIFRALLTDFTGSIPVFSFVSEANLQKYNELEQSSPVFVTGTVDRAFKSTDLEFKIKNISYCELPADFKEVVYKKKAPLSYTTVRPEPFVAATQANLFEAAETAVDPYFVGKKFVVFDTETTGVNMRTDRIVEIACIRIEDGKFSESLQTFVNPGMPIPEGASRVNHITDEMVADAPRWEDVVGDVYKFCDGCTLVGHNVTFDIAMLNNTAKQTHYYFENAYLDTLSMSQRKVPGARNYTLATMLRVFDIVNENAHRALDDTLATAKLFMKLAQIR